MCEFSKMDYISSDIKSEINNLLNKNELLMKELDYYKAKDYRENNKFLIAYYNK